MPLLTPIENKASISVCICARNRPAELIRALTSISQSSIVPGQIVVSDDSDDDRVKEVVTGHPLAITYTRGPRSGLGANRNHAISLATGQYLLFLDDDGYIGRTFLSTIVTHLLSLTPETRARTIMAGVEVKNGESVVPHDLGFLGFQSRLYRPGQPLRTFVINAALFPRALFDRVSFDPNLVYGYDEVDIATHAIKSGFTIEPCFDAVNCHYPSTVGRDEYRSYTQASRLYVTLKRRHFIEERPLYGWIGFIVAVGHVYLTSLRYGGLDSLRDARSTSARAYGYYKRFAISQSRRNGSASI